MHNSSCAFILTPFRASCYSPEALACWCSKTVNNQFRTSNIQTTTLQTLNLSNFKPFRLHILNLAQSIRLKLVSQFSNLQFEQFTTDSLAFKALTAQHTGWGKTITAAQIPIAAVESRSLAATNPITATILLDFSQLLSNSRALKKAHGPWSPWPWAPCAHRAGCEKQITAAKVPTIHISTFQILKPPTFKHSSFL